MQVEVGDLVRVVADNCNFGPGLVVEVETEKEGSAYRVLTSDGQCLYYFLAELRPLWSCEALGEWVQYDHETRRST